MKYKKMISSATAVLVAASLLAGCNTKDNGTTPPSPATTKTVEAEKPLKFTLMMSDNANKYALQSPDINKDKWVQEINKRCNVEMNLKLADHKKFQEQVQMTIASGDIPDVLYIYGDWKSASLGGAVENGAFWELDELLVKQKDKVTNLMKLIPEQAWKEAKNSEGKTLGIPLACTSVGQAYGAYIRSDLLEKYNLKVPTALDEWVNVMKVFKDNGMKYPYIGRENWSFTDLFFGAFGVQANRWSLNDKGELIPDVIKPEMKEALKFHAKLREQGLMNPESLTTNATVWGNKISAGEVGMFMHQPQGLGDWNSKITVPGAKFALVAAPAGAKGEKGIGFGPVTGSSAFINKKFAQPERILQFFDTLATDAMQDFLVYGSEEGAKTYQEPTETMAVLEANFRSSLRLVYDTSYNKRTLPLIKNGNDILKWFTEIAPKEGYHAYKVEKLKAFDLHPDLNSANMTAFALWQQYAAKIFLGQLPADAYDEFVKEFYKRGGDEIIKEANEAYKANKSNISKF